MPRWVDKLLRDVAAGHVTQAILIGQTRSSGAEWFQRAMAACSAFCLPKRLVYCWNADNPHGSTYAPSASVFFYFGNNVGKFTKVFGKFGEVVVHNRPAAKQAAMSVVM
jgi:hypothetical protein